MLHILFLILKIIGIILLVILGIALVLVGVVLFVPVRYRVKIETTDKLKGLRTEAKATWLFHLVKAHVTYREDKLTWQLRVAWKKFHVENETEEIAPKSETEVEHNMATENVKDTETSTARATTETPKKKTQKVNWFEKIKCTLKEFCDRIKNIKEFITDEVHIQALVRLKKELLYFIKKIKPKQIKGYFRFGLEDPYNTGQVLALLSLLYPFYGENLEIYPEFDREIVEGDVFMKGRVHMLHLLKTICKLYFDDNIKTAYKNFKTIKE